MAASSEGGAGSPGQPGKENTGGEREEEENEKALASGILGVLAPAVRHLDETVGEVRQSQTELRQQIDQLADDLRQLSEKQKVPVDLDTYIKKLAISRRRILLVNDILQNVQERMEKLQRNITKESARQRAAIEACH